MWRSLILLYLLLHAVAIGNSGPSVSKHKTFKYEEVFTLDTLTVYNPVISQCDADPLITASNAKIDTTKLRKGKIKWMALSRDMLTRWNGKINYGDTVRLITGDKSIDKHYWIIQDTMNKRYKRHGDLLFAKRNKGMWNNVKMIKV